MLTPQLKNLKGRERIWNVAQIGEPNIYFNHFSLLELKSEGTN